MIVLPVTLAAFAMQDHQAHGDHGAHPQPQEAPAEPMDHGTMDHGAMDHDMSQPPQPDAEDHGAMHHDMAAPPAEKPQEMDHAAMGHAMPADIPLAGPPDAAGEGPARAAVAIYGEEAMRTAREALIRDTGGGTHMLVMADRAEVRIGGRHQSYLWDAQGWYGGDIDKLWIKSEGEGEFGGALESADIEALWSHAITPFFDAQVGVRQDFTGPDRTYLAAGVQGLAPYEFEVDASAYLSTRGDVTAKIEAELDQRMTQRLILQPRGEVRVAAQDVPEVGIGAGLSVVEAGVRLRYEIAREFAPYVGVSQEWRIGRTADFARADGEDASATRIVAGIRAWF